MKKYWIPVEKEVVFDLKANGFKPCEARKTLLFFTEREFAELFVRKSIDADMLSSATYAFIPVEMDETYVEEHSEKVSDFDVTYYFFSGEIEKDKIPANLDDIPLMSFWVTFERKNNK